MAKKANLKNNDLVVAIGLGLAVLLIQAVFEWAPVWLSNSSDALKPNEQEGIIVEMIPDGFSSTTITINRGETITWVNNDTDFRWPASNVHPNHDQYPEFDPLEPVPPGESWSFTFDQAGEWEFHDHLKPYFIGTVIVSE